MTVEHAPGTLGDKGVARARGVWREARRQLFYLGVLLAALLLLGLIVGTASVAAQALRDEARSVDVVLVVADAAPSQALVEHCFELYRRGYGPQLVLIGPGSEGLGAALRELGVAEDTLVTVVSPGGETEQLRAALESARAAGAVSVLIAGDGAEMLRRIKLASDEGVRAYGTPIPGEEVQLLGLLRGSVAYWNYVFLGR